MSLPRKEVTFYLASDIHDALKALAEADGVAMSAYVERDIVPIICRRIHKYRLIAERTKNLDIPRGIAPDVAGVPGVASQQTTNKGE